MNISKYGDKLRQTMKPIILPEQKERFEEYYTRKAFRIERNMAGIIIAMQACMILIFSFRKGGPFISPRRIGYFSLYSMLLIATSFFLTGYINLVKSGRFHSVIILRRVYTCILFIWCIGITMLEQFGGNTIGVYCYLIPTIAALLLMEPLESILFFSINWGVVVVLLVVSGVNQENLFGNIINGTFVTFLSVFISIRYNRSVEAEFRDREIISMQYKKIQKANDKLHEMAFTDQLTGLHNRRYLMEKILDHFEEYQNKDCYLEMIMVDIDYFKQYNDTYGHLEVDVCLKKIADILEEYEQIEGTAAIRYGGEEFLLVRISKQPGEESRMEEALMKHIDSANIPREDTPWKKVTVSIGIWKGNTRELEKGENAIRYADKALYCAKSSGRNCIYRYNQEEFCRE